MKRPTCCWIFWSVNMAWWGSLMGYFLGRGEVCGPLVVAGWMCVLAFLGAGDISGRAPMTDAERRP